MVGATEFGLESVAFRPSDVAHNRAVGFVSLAFSTRPHCELLSRQLLTVCCQKCHGLRPGGGTLSLSDASACQPGTTCALIIVVHLLASLSA
jgi:hypothetical protein